jgi:hypothetical protein
MHARSPARSASWIAEVEKRSHRCIRNLPAALPVLTSAPVLCQLVGLSARHLQNVNVDRAGFAWNRSDHSIS